MKFKMIIDKTKEEEVIATVHTPSTLTQELEALVMRYAGCDKLPAYTEDDRTLLAFSDIECITILNRKVTAIDVRGHRYRIQERLRDLEAILPSYFIRINKSALANEHRIARFVPVFSGGVDAEFECGYREYVSRRCFAEIRRRYEGK